MSIVELDPKSTNEACWCNIDDRKLDRVCYISRGDADNTIETYNARDNHLKKVKYHRIISWSTCTF